MLRAMKFGECLHYLLSTLDISINRLSKAINIDNSLVNRWVNNKRIPSYKTTYIDAIAEYLSKKFVNSYQINRLDELYSKLCKNTEPNTSIENKLKTVLLEAQGYSIECRKQEREIKKSQITPRKSP